MTVLTAAASTPITTASTAQTSVPSAHETGETTSRYIPDRGDDVNGGYAESSRQPPR